MPGPVAAAHCDPSGRLSFARRKFDRSVHRILAFERVCPAGRGRRSILGKVPRQCSAQLLQRPRPSRSINAKRSDLTVHRWAYFGSSSNKFPRADWYFDSIDDSSKTLQHFAQCGGFALSWMVSFDSRFEIALQRQPLFPLLHPQARRLPLAKASITHRVDDLSDRQFSIALGSPSTIPEAHRSVAMQTVEHDNQFYHEATPKCSRRQK